MAGSQPVMDFMQSHAMVRFSRPPLPPLLSVPTDACLRLGCDGAGSESYVKILSKGNPPFTRRAGQPARMRATPSMGY